MRNTVCLKTIMCCSVLLTAAVLCAGKAPENNIHDLNTLLAAMKETEDTLATLQFSFVQELWFQESSEKETMTGKALFKKPNCMRIENQKPEKNVLVSDGVNVWYYTPAQNNVMTGTWDSISANAGNIFKGLLSFSQSIEELRSAYHLTYMGKDASLYKMSITPAQQRAHSFTMMLWIDERDFIPRRTEMTVQSFTIHTSIKHVVANKKIDDAVFTFSIPRDVSEIPFP